MFQSHFGEIAALLTAVFWTVTSMSFEAAGKRIGSLTVNLLRFCGVTLPNASPARVAIEKYGPEFAQFVTDAHEQGDTDNTEAEHQMDYTNNQIGRKYALNDIKEKQILPHLLRDREVVRHPR